MTGNSILIILTALVYIGAGCVVAQIARLLSRDYATRRSAHWAWRGLLWLGAVVLLFRSVTLLYPGRAFAVHALTPVVLLVGVVVLGLAMWKLDDVMRERDPPPWSVQLMRLAALTGWNGLVMRSAMTVPPASFGDQLPDSMSPGRRRQLAMMVAAGAAVAIIVTVIVINSPAAR